MGILKKHESIVDLASAHTGVQVMVRLVVQVDPVGARHVCAI